MSISELSVKRPVAMCMVVMIIVVLGLYSLTMLPMDLYPNITMPMILVRLTHGNGKYGDKAVRGCGCYGKRHQERAVHLIAGFVYDYCGIYTRDRH